MIILNQRKKLIIGYQSILNDEAIERSNTVFMTVNGYLICNALIIFVPLLGVAIYNKIMKIKKKDKGISLLSVLLIISIVLMVLKYITKEELFSAFSCLVDLSMAFVIIRKIRAKKESYSINETMYLMFGGILIMMIPVVLAAISTFIL